MKLDSKQYFLRYDLAYIRFLIWEKLAPKIGLKTRIMGFDSFQFLTSKSHNSLSKTPFLVFLELVTSFLSPISDINSDNFP